MGERGIPALIAAAWEYIRGMGAGALLRMGVVLLVMVAVAAAYVLPGWRKDDDQYE